MGTLQIHKNVVGKWEGRGNGVESGRERRELIQIPIPFKQTLKLNTTNDTKTNMNQIIQILETERNIALEFKAIQL